MIVSRGRGYIFVHIPKTGGTAMALALEDRAMADDILIGDTPKAKNRRGRLRGVKTEGQLWKHATLADAIGLVSQDEIEALFTFTLVRNPWDRMVSYYHWLKTQTFDHPAVIRAQAMTFSAFVNDPSTSASLRAHPYAAYMTDPDGREQADLYIRLEHLDADLVPLQAHLGFPLRLDRVNQSNRPRDWRGFYTDADAQHVADICAQDIARHGYRFDPDGPPLLD